MVCECTGCALSFSEALTRAGSLDKQNFLEALKVTPPTLINIGFSFIALCSVISLCGFHTYLIALDRSTNEDVRAALRCAA